MHHIAYLGCTLQFLDFLLLFGGAHLHHSLDKVDACRLFLLYGVDAEQIEYLQFYVKAVRRQGSECGASV